MSKMLPLIYPLCMQTSSGPYLHHQDNKYNYANAIKKIVSVHPGTHTPKCYLVWVSGMGLIGVQGLDSKPHLVVNVRVHVHICAILSGSGARSGSKPHPNGEVRVHLHISALLFHPIYIRIYHFNGGLEPQFELSFGAEVRYAIQPHGELQYIGKKIGST